MTALTEANDPSSKSACPRSGSGAGGHRKRYVAEMIPDGATLQIGYGGIPDAVVMQLTDKHDLGIHTEMVGDGIMTLVEAGVVTNRKKNYHHGKMLATFALGSKKLYQFMHRNPALEMHPVDFTNDPFLAGQNDNLHAINATMQIDFLGQCGSESLGPIPYSGTAASPTSCAPPTAPRAARPSSMLPSTAKDDTISRIVPTLSPGTHVSDQQERHQLRGDRVRRCPVARQDGQATDRSPDRHRSPRFPW